jgi:hypothetical protein
VRQAPPAPRFTLAKPGWAVHSKAAMGVAVSETWSTGKKSKQSSTGRSGHPAQLWARTAERP